MKKIIPFGDRLLVRRKTVGKQTGMIQLPEEVQDRPTDLADVVYVPEHSFADKELIKNAETIVNEFTAKAKVGDSEALKALLEYNYFLKMKSIKVGDKVMISKYVGITFHDNQGGGDLTLVKDEDIIGLVTDE